MSYELFFGEVIHQGTNFFSNVTKLFADSRIRKGISQMKNIKRDKYAENTQSNCGQCYDCTSPNTFWESYRIQKEMR